MFSNIKKYRNLVKITIYTTYNTGRYSFKACNVSPLYKLQSFQEKKYKHFRPACYSLKNLKPICNKFQILIFCLSAYQKSVIELIEPYNKCT